MELRYVYRKVEDAIGAPLNIKESQHSWLTRQLRYSFREAKDIAHHTEMNALCLAALSGNPRVDALDMNEKIDTLLDKALWQAVPYLKSVFETAKEPTKSSYELAFEQLAEFTKELNSNSASTKIFKESGADAQQQET